MTGSYGAGLARHLRYAGISVVEVDRPNRQMRNRQGKSDHVDAIAATRAALSGTASGLPKGRDGNVEAIRVLMIARRSAVDERIQILNQIRHLCFCASDEIRTRFEDLSPKRLINATSTLRPRQSDDVVRYTTLIVLRELGRRARKLHEETKRLHRLNRGGNRQANSALYHVMLTRMRHHQPTRDYIARRSGEGKTMGEICRMLRRYIAREIYADLPRPA